MSAIRACRHSSATPLQGRFDRAGHVASGARRSPVGVLFGDGVRRRREGRRLHEGVVGSHSVDAQSVSALQSSSEQERRMRHQNLARGVHRRAEAFPRRVLDAIRRMHRFLRLHPIRALRRRHCKGSSMRGLVHKVIGTALVVTAVSIGCIPPTPSHPNTWSGSAEPNAIVASPAMAPTIARAASIGAAIGIHRDAFIIEAT